MSTMQELVEKHVSYADRLAMKRKKTLPNFIDIDELKSAAYMGLVEAASRYRPELGVKFTTSSFRRIVGAMNDYLREQGWMKNDGYQEMLSLDAPSADGNGCTLSDTIESRSDDGSVEECFEAIAVNLGDQAKAVLHCYFIDENSMKEVGEKFGVSESRISQLIKTYKKQIKDHWEFFELCDMLAA